MHNLNETQWNGYVSYDALFTSHKNILSLMHNSHCTHVKSNKI